MEEKREEGGRRSRVPCSRLMFIFINQLDVHKSGYIQYMYISTIRE